MAIVLTLASEHDGITSKPRFLHHMTFAVGGDNYLTDGLDCDLAAELPDGQTLVKGIALPNGPYTAFWDLATKKLKVFTSNGAAPAALLEYPNATGLTATFDILAIVK